MAGMKVCWISAGVSSFVAGYLAEKVDEYIYIDIENQHPDSMRFIKDCERALGKPIQILRSDYRNVQNVIKQFHFINSPYGAKCTEILKKESVKNGNMNIGNRKSRMCGDLILMKSIERTGF